jgi:hypothetical protein
MSLSLFRMRLLSAVAALLLTAILSGCAQAALSQIQPGQASQAATVAPAVTAAPTTVSASPTAAPAIPNGNGLAYHYDAALATGDTVEVIPAVAGTSDSPYWQAAPEYRQVTLNGYPVTEHSFKPQIFIYPAEAFKSANPEAAKVIEGFTAALQAPDQSQDLPFLPLLNARQALHAHLQPLNFKDGQGLRYLTQYAQGLVPINNHHLIYTYQGLTRDGKYYIAAVLPVTQSSLPVDETVTGQEPPEFTSDYPKYLVNVTAALNAQPGDAFTPDLAKLDALVSSLEIQ